MQTLGPNEAKPAMDETVCAPAQSGAHEMKRGALAILPLALGASVYGMAFGLLAVQVGFPWWGVGIMSVSRGINSTSVRCNGLGR